MSPTGVKCFVEILLSFTVQYIGKQQYLAGFFFLEKSVPNSSSVIFPDRDLPPARHLRDLRHVLHPRLLRHLPHRGEDHQGATPPVRVGGRTHDLLGGRASVGPVHVPVLRTSMRAHIRRF